MAFLVLLESLSPVERAVFLLREVFDYPYDEIAETIGKSEDNTRQLAVCARGGNMEERKPRFEADKKARDELAGKFWAAAQDGDTDGLVKLLADDVGVLRRRRRQGPGDCQAALRPREGAALRAPFDGADRPRWTSCSSQRR